jgi:arylsulfatase A-like enzyme
MGSLRRQSFAFEIARKLRINCLRTDTRPITFVSMSSNRRDSAQRKRGWFAVALVAAIGWTCAQGQTVQTNSAPPEPRKPCILLIVADDLGWGDLGCYGQQKIKTPNIDKLASEGMRFTSFYAGSSLSTPSRTSLLTGMDTGHARDRGAGVIPLEASDTTIAQVLKVKRFATLAMGKWELGYMSPPGRKGFDEWAGFLNDAESRDYYPQMLSRTENNEDHFAQLSLNLNGKRGEYIDDLITEGAMKFMAWNNPQDYTYYRPWFEYLAYTLPYASAEDGPQTSGGATVRSDAPYTDYAWAPAEKTRAAMITLLDTYVGEMLDKLAALKNDKNTIVIFTSATGPEKDTDLDPKFFNSTGGLRGGKHDLYEGGIRVPLIIRWPIGMRGGKVSDVPCAAWDLLPTLAEATIIKPPTNIDGISILPTLLGKEQTNRHDYLYWELHDHGFKQALRMGDWKAVRPGADAPLELYNLKSDPGETNNVAADNPAVITRITDYLKTARTDDPNWPMASATEPGR